MNATSQEFSQEPHRNEGKKTRLGRGLSALLGEYLPEGEISPDGLRVLPVARVAPNPFQPRREFPPEELAELEASIRENGLLQPLVVRPASAGAPPGVEWELVSGERRWRAIRRLKRVEVPALIKDVDDRAMLVLAIVENVQRANLSPLEEAQGYRRLVDDFGFTQREIAESVGRERSTVANLLRLLQLPASVQRLVNDGKISMGHARAILGMPDERRMAALARDAAKEGLSVRAVEDRVRRGRNGASNGTASRSSATSATGRSATDAHLRHLEAELQRAFGTAARIRVTQGERGRIELPFYGAEDFERVVELLLGADVARS